MQEQFEIYLITHYIMLLYMLTQETRLSVSM